MIVEALINSRKLKKRVVCKQTHELKERLMFDYRNSTSNSLLAWILVFNKHIRSSTLPWKKFYLRTSLITVYYIAASQIWQLLQLVCDANGRARIIVFPCWRRRKKTYVLFTMHFQT